MQGPRRTPPARSGYGSQVRVLPREFHGPMALNRCACTTVLIVPAACRIVAQLRRAVTRPCLRGERTGGLGAIAGGLEEGTARRLYAHRADKIGRAHV